MNFDENCSSNNSEINYDYPIFITYTNTKIIQPNNNPNQSNNNENIKFNCSKCGKSFTNFYVLKRHFIEVEYNKKEQCIYCQNYFKRVKEHQIHCSFKKLNDNKISLNNNSTFNNEPINIDNNKGFDIKNITKQLITEFISQYNYIKLNDNYIYFPNFCLGEGTYGYVIFGLKLDTYLPVSIKVQKSSHKTNDLKIEAEVLSKMSSKMNYPKLFYYEINSAGNLLIESLLGPNLSIIYKFCEKDFDLKSICNIGIDIINFLEQFHDIGYLHLDMKPNNIVFTLENIKNNESNISCILIDYGFSYKLNNNNEKQNKRKKIFSYGGNYRFASINLLDNGIPSKKDDLESLIYILIYFYKSYLPWNYDSDDKNICKKIIKEKKTGFDVIEFVGENFKEINEIYNDVKNLGNNERPHYSKYKEILLNVSKKMIKTNNSKYKFKWQEKFSLIIRELYDNNNIELINTIISDIFKGYPQKLAFAYINQYYK